MNASEIIKNIKVGRIVSVFGRIVSVDTEPDHNGDFTGSTHTGAKVRVNTKFVKCVTK